MKRRFSFTCCFAVCLIAYAGLTPRTIEAADQAKWTASWITHPTAPLREPLVLHFRRSFQLATKPTGYIVHVSADNRFVLYVNGHRVGDGPARGDLSHWRYETFDLSQYLVQGSNFVTATVWNYGIYAPVAQITDRIAFLLQGDGAAEADISTPKDWMVEVEPGQRPVPRKAGGSNEYMANGPGEELDAAKYDWSWNDPNATGGAWVAAASPMRENIYPSASRAGLSGQQVDNYWQLVRDELPHMDYTPTDAGKVVRSDEPNAAGFPSATGRGCERIGTCTFLLDRKTLTTGLSAVDRLWGCGREHSADLFRGALRRQSIRRVIAMRSGCGRRMGFHDTFLPDGKAHRTFEPLWWRTGAISTWIFRPEQRR